MAFPGLGAVEAEGEAASLRLIAGLESCPSYSKNNPQYLFSKTLTINFISPHKMHSCCITNTFEMSLAPAKLGSEVSS